MSEGAGSWCPVASAANLWQSPPSTHLEFGRDILLPVTEPVEIVVTGEPLRDPESEAVLSTTLIDAEQLEQSPTTQLDQLLKSVPSLQLFRRSDAHSGHPTSQGITLRALGGNASSRALLTLDGVPQADPFGGWINWPAYDPLGLGSMRITRGGGSVVAGPGALAGIIELESGAPEPGIAAGLEIGSRASFEARSSAATDLTGGVLSLNGRYGRGEGFVPVIASQRGPADRASPYEEASLRGRYVRAVGAGVEAQLSAAAFIDRRERGLRFTGNRTRGADAALRLVGNGRWGWTALAYGQWRGFESSFASVDDERTTVSRVALQDDVPSSAIGGSFEIRPPVGGGSELRLGGDARNVTGHSHELYFYQAGQPTRERDSGGKTSTFGAFGEASHHIGPLLLTAAGRIDRWHIGDGFLEERLLAGGTALTDVRYSGRGGWLPTGRAGLSAGLGSGFTGRAAAYLGWRLPTLNELFRPFRAGADATAANARLDPERIRGVEAGLNWKTRSVEFDATLFSNSLKDPITNVTLGFGPGVFPGVGFVGKGGVYRQRRNAGVLHVRGLELNGRAERGAWTLAAGYGFADAETSERLRPAQTPRHSASASLGWSRGGWSAALRARYAGEQFEDDLNRLKLPAATTFDLFAQLPLAKRLQLVARAENLLGRRVVAGISGEGIVERATPRTLNVGLRLTR